VIEITRLFRKHVKNEEDIIFGFIIGSIIMVIGQQTLMLYKRKPTEDEFKETREVLLRRILEIKTKILQALN
jgi:hypothetical protein